MNTFSLMIRGFGLICVMPLLGVGCLSSSVDELEVVADQGAEEERAFSSTISVEELEGAWEVREGPDLQWIEFSQNGTYLAVKNFLPFGEGEWALEDDGFHFSSGEQEDLVFTYSEYTDNILTFSGEEVYMVLERYVKPEEPSEATITFLVAYEEYEFPAVGDSVEFDAVVREALSASAFDLIAREFVLTGKDSPEESYALYSFKTNYWDSAGVEDSIPICSGAFGDGYDTCVLAHETVDGIEPVRLFDNFNTYSALVSSNATEFTWELSNDGETIYLEGISQDNSPGEVWGYNTLLEVFEEFVK